MFQDLKKLTYFFSAAELKAPPDQWLDFERQRQTVELCLPKAVHQLEREILPQIDAAVVTAI
jgi:hypothetical protein